MIQSACNGFMTPAPAVPPERRRAVIFDMDGVLVDSELRWKEAEAGLFRELGLPGAEKDHERFVGLGVFDLHDLLVSDYGLEPCRERFFELSRRIAEEVYLRKVVLAPRARELLEELKGRQTALALASSSPGAWVRLVLGRFGLDGLLDAAVGVDDAGGAGKPAPDVYLRAAGLLKISPDGCAAVEDSRYGVEAAKRAGMFCVAFRNGSNDGQDLSGADAEARGFGELRLLLTR